MSFIKTIFELSYLLNHLKYLKIMTATTFVVRLLKVSMKNDNNGFCPIPPVTVGDLSIHKSPQTPMIGDIVNVGAMFSEEGTFGWGVWEGRGEVVFVQPPITSLSCSNDFEQFSK